MATHLYTSYSPIATRTISSNTNNSNKVLSLPLQHRHAKSIASSSLSLRPTTRLSISAAVGTTAVQVDGPTTSSKGPKSLPFRVGHGFDLHRLEPGYPLIIGGINIPHERGCEAHSDGNFADTVAFCFLLSFRNQLNISQFISWRFNIWVSIISLYKIRREPNSSNLLKSSSLKIFSGIIIDV